MEVVRGGHGHEVGGGSVLRVLTLRCRAQQTGHSFADAQDHDLFCEAVRGSSSARRVFELRPVEPPGPTLFIRH